MKPITYPLVMDHEALERGGNAGSRFGHKVLTACGVQNTGGYSNTRFLVL